MYKYFWTSILIILCAINWMHADKAAYDPVLWEENGYENIMHYRIIPPHQAHGAERPVICLLIPDSDNDKICMFDYLSGEYLGDFIIDDTSSTPQYDFQTPLNAIQGPGPETNIFVSDQVSDAIYVFDPAYGQYLYTYADSSDGLNNIRGIAFRGDHLFVSCGDYHVAEFDGPHSFVRYFIQDGSNPFDILFLDNDQVLISDIQGTADNVRLYDSSGTYIQNLFAASTPEQLQEDATHPDTFLNCSFAEDLIRRFLLDGTVISSTPFSTPRGVYRLDNGNYLITNGSGVFEVNPANGSVIEQEYTYSARFIELVCLLIGVKEMHGKPVGPMVKATPNPFSQQVTILFSLDYSAQVEVSIYSVQGRMVKRLIDDYLLSGMHHLIWDGTDEHGHSISNGIYFIHVITAGQPETTRKILYIK